MNDHKAAAADIAGARIGHGQRKADRDRGVDRIAALLQNVGADPRGHRLLRHHHAVRGGDGLRVADSRNPDDLRRAPAAAAREGR